MQPDELPATTGVIVRAEMDTTSVRCSDPGPGEAKVGRETGQ